MFYPKRICGYFIFLALVLFTTNICTAQNEKDSLLAVLKTTKVDTIKVKILHRLYVVTDSVSYSRAALDIALTSRYKRGMALAYLDIGRHYYFDGKPEVSLGYLVKCVKAAEELGEKRILINAYRYIGYIYRPDDPYIAEDYYNKSLKLARETKEELLASYALSGLGNIYEMIFDVTSASNKKALQYYLESLQIRERLGSNDEIAASLNETSRMYDVLGFHDKTLELRLRGLEVAEKAGSAENIEYLCNVLGNEYSVRLHEYKKGLAYHLRAYATAKTQKNNLEVSYDIDKGLAYDYYKLGDINKSVEFYQYAISLNDSMKSEGTKHDYNLSGLKHGLEQELEKEKLLLKDTEISKEKAEAATQATLRNASLVVFGIILIMAIIVLRGYRLQQKSNGELAIKNKEIENAYKVLAISENQFKLITETINDVFYLFNIKEKRYEYISPNCNNLLGLTQEWIYEHNTMKGVVYYEDLQMVKDANLKVDSGHAYEIEYRIVVNDEIKWVAEKSSPIFDEKGVLVRNSGICRDITRRKANEQIIEQKNKDIRDSILYARTIQNAILVPKNDIEKDLKDFFILSKPKDIVSGDFYFYKETDEGLIVAVADCTGHGVPGGFMSMLGSAYLNEIINNNKGITPARILDKLGKRIIRSLNQNTSYASNKDGMDIALLRFGKDYKTVEFAGAFNPFYLIRNGELQEFAGDKFPIGINISGHTPFTNNLIDLKPGDALYLFTDGYVDQFGGPEIKKFMKKQMKELLVNISDKKMDEQEKIMDKTYEDWKGEQMQIDDVMVMGIRI
jgi:PAS domain S-box-containing protein